MSKESMALNKALQRHLLDKGLDVKDVFYITENTGIIFKQDPNKDEKKAVLKSFEMYLEKYIEPRQREL